MMGMLLIFVLHSFFSSSLFHSRLLYLVSSPIITRISRFPTWRCVNIVIIDRKLFHKTSNSSKKKLHRCRQQTIHFASCETTLGISFFRVFFAVRNFSVSSFCTPVVGIVCKVWPERLTKLEATQPPQNMESDNSKMCVCWYVQCPLYRRCLHIHIDMVKSVFVHVRWN